KNIMIYCSWCEKEISLNEITYCKSEDNDKHNLCSSCHLSGHACQTSCPLYWYNLSELLILKDNLCSGCIKPLNDDTKKKFDKKGHTLCCQCQQCILCLFRLQI